MYYKILLDESDCGRIEATLAESINELKNSGQAKCTLQNHRETLRRFIEQHHEQTEK